MPSLYPIISLTLLAIASFDVNARDYFKDRPGFIEQNLKQKNYNIDTSANAIVLYEKYDYDLSTGNNLIVWKVRQVVKILKKSGVHNADIAVQVYHLQNHFTKIRKISGTTYNLDSGIVTSQKLDADNINSGTYDEIKAKKFSMPAVHEGSVIDYTFEIEYPLTRNFCKWEIEGPIPKLYSELEIHFPYRLEVQALQQNVHEFQKKADEKNDDLLPDAYTTDETSGNIIEKRFVRRNIPAISPEPYVYNINNYKERMSLYIKGITGDNEATDYSWDKLNEHLFRSPEFYKAVTKRDGDVAAKAAELAANENNDITKAIKIYSYVRDSITMRKDESIWVKKYPGDVLADKAGTVTEINMLLMAMLEDVEIPCYPVVLSTRQNGLVSDLFPDQTRFNYTICDAVISNKTYYLDASGRYNPFGTLPEKCYNGYARLINKQGAALFLNPDSAKEAISVKVTTEHNADTAYGLSIYCTFTGISAIWHRQNWNTDSAELKDFIVNTLLKDASLSLHMKSYEVKNLHAPDSTLILIVHAVAEWPANEKMVYLDPYFHKYFKKNYFTNSTRKYDVDMPCLYNITYDCQLQLPIGYSVEDTLPPYNIRLDDNAKFTSTVNYEKETNTINAHYHIQTMKTLFPIDEYLGLKYFFDKMILAQQKTLAIKKL